MHVRNLLRLFSTSKLGWSSGILVWSNQPLPWRGWCRAGFSNTSGSLLPFQKFQNGLDSELENVYKPTTRSHRTSCIAAFKPETCTLQPSIYFAGNLGIFWISINLLIILGLSASKAIPVPLTIRSSLKRHETFEIIGSLMFSFMVLARKCLFVAGYTRSNSCGGCMHASLSQFKQKRQPFRITLLPAVKLSLTYLSREPLFRF